MSMRGLAVALLCGVLGLGLGIVVAHAAQPGSTTGGDAHPIAAVSPSVPIDRPSHSPYAPDIDWPSLQPGLPIPITHEISNDLAHWTYHVPQGWQAYWVCSNPSSCPPDAYPDKPMAAREIDHAQEVRFRPPGEPLAGGFSLRVRILQNTFVDVHQTVATKVVGFGDSDGIADYKVLHRDARSVQFEYRDASSNYHRFNFFEWFAIPDHSNATLEMSVSGRRADRAGLTSLFQRFADYAVGRPPSGKH